MSHPHQYILYLDDYHASDPLFLQSLGRALARQVWQQGPIVVHGSGEAGERMLEASGIFRERRNGVLAVQSAQEAALVEQGIRRLNQKIVEIFTDAIVSTVGILGTQRRALVVLEDGSLRTDGTWIHRLAEKGIVTVLGAFAQREADDATGEIPVWDAVEALARSFAGATPEIVFFTSTNLPGVMRGGAPIPELDATDGLLDSSVGDKAAMQRISRAGFSVLLTNTTRFADPGGPIGTKIVSTP